VRRPAPAAPPPVDAAAPVRAAPRIASEHGRRHELVAAMNLALGVESSASQDKHAEQAVFRFAHALMHDLRTLVGEEREGARAWGRSDWGDLSQRLSALATAAGGAAAERRARGARPTEPADGHHGRGAHHVGAELAPAGGLRRDAAGPRPRGRSAGRRADALDGAAQGPGDAAARAALAELARRLASGLTPSSGATLPAGAVVDESA
jgi:hypothetical protein